MCNTVSAEMENEWKFLSKIYQLLVDENYLNTKSDEEAKVVEFVHPNKLKKIIDFSLDSEKPLCENEIERLCKCVLKYSVKTGHPNFHNQLFGGMDPYGLAGAWITEALNTSQYTYEVGPVFTLIETYVIQKVLSLFNYTNGDGIFTPGGSISNMYGMVLARYKRNPKIKEFGLFDTPPLVAFTSEDSHYSIKKSIHWLGIGTNNLILVKTNDRGQMVVSDLEEKIKTVINENKVPFFVNATAGTTVLGAFDNFNEISEICKKYQIWMHVDACLGGSAILSKTHSHLLDGIEKSNSMSWNPHKTLGAPLQCSIFLVNEKGLLHACNSANAQYLFQQDKFYDVSYDTGDKSVQCGRKIDAFKLWMMFKARGWQYFEELIDNTFEQAEYFFNRIRTTPGFLLVLNELQYTNIPFWYVPRHLRGLDENDEWWKEVYEIPVKLKKMMVDKGTIMVGYTPLSHKQKGNFFRMVCTCYPRPTKESMDTIIDEIAEMAEQLYST